MKPGISFGFVARLKWVQGDAGSPLIDGVPGESEISPWS